MPLATAAKTAATVASATPMTAPPPIRFLKPPTAAPGGSELPTREARRRLECVLKDVIGRGQLDGSITATESPEALARFLVNTFAGINLWGQAKLESAVATDVVRVALGALRNGKSTPLS